MVLIPQPLGDTGRRWVEAEVRAKRNEATVAAQQLFQFGYSPAPGEHYRVEATDVVDTWA
jgi:hypothetical protein